MRTFSVFASLATTASLWAQGTFISPPAVATVEGNAGANAFLYYSNARHQHAEGELRGKKLSLTEVAWRMDHRNHTAGTAMGRKWTNVTLNLADTDWMKMGRTFSNNQYTTPVEVFNAALAVSSVLGTPFNKPDLFKHTIPFKNPYSYTGSNDLLLDWVFLGGTMDNNAAWSGTKSYSYYLDGNNPTVTYTSPRTYYPATEPSPRCRDSAISSNVSAHTYATLRVHGITHTNLQYRDQVQFELYSKYTAPNGRIITAIAFAGIPSGVNIGARCNLLYTALQGPWIALGRTANSSGNSSTFTTFTPWDPAMANIPIWVQTTWSDSKLNVFSLTRAMHVVMPPDKPHPRRIVVVYNYKPASATGSGPYLNRYGWAPITRYTYK